MIKEIYLKVSEDLNIPYEVVKLAYESYWSFIREHIKQLPLKEDLTEEEFNELKTNFNIPSLGKLCVTYERFLNTRKSLEYITKIKNTKNDYNKKA